MTTPSPAERCICACAVQHPPSPVRRCNAVAVTYRALTGAGVGTVTVPLCYACDLSWRQLDKGIAASR
jgi:hypothetical protein